MAKASTPYREREISNGNVEIEKQMATIVLYGCETLPLTKNID
jgi:hypothetical protein